LLSSIKPSIYLFPVFCSKDVRSSRRRGTNREEREEIAMRQVNTHLKTLLVGAVLAACYGLSPSAAFAATVTVGNCQGSSPYSTIQAAVNAVPAASTVNVCPGDYFEQVIIAKALTLQGIAAGNAEAAVIFPPTAGLAQSTTSLVPSDGGFPLAAGILVSGAINVKLSNLTVDGTGNDADTCGLNVIGILYQNASGTVNEVVARNQTLPGFTGCQTGVGIYVQSGAGGKSTVTVSNSSVHDYQKGGIVGRGIGTTLTASGNSVRGLGPDPLVAQNGIEIGVGATGTISNNAVADDIYQNAVTPGDGASGILVFASTKVQVVSNTIGNNQFGITIASDPVLGVADSATIRNNNIFGTILFDGIDLCSNKNVATGNNVVDSAQSAVHFDDTCGTTGNQNTVSGNTINEACAGLLRGSTTSGNVVVLNTAFNVVNQILSGDTCSSSDAPAVATTSAIATDGLASPTRQY
jgi:hypothetical protein